MMRKGEWNYPQLVANQESDMTIRFEYISINSIPFFHDILELADALGYKRFNLTGHDFGAMVSWGCIHRYRRNQIVHDLGAISKYRWP